MSRLYRNSNGVLVFGRCLVAILWFLFVGSQSGFAGPEDSCPTQAQLDTIASLNSPDAVARLGDLYYRGPAATANPYLAFAYYSRAAALGSSSSKFQIAEMTLTGDGTEKDVARAVAMLEEMGKNGSSTALDILGEVYSRGRDTPMDPQKAISNLQRAAAASDIRALEKLAEFYQYGRYASPNPVKAEQYYRSAIKAGDDNARVGLGTLMLDRKPLRKTDVNLAMDEFAKAADAGVSRAEVARARFAMTSAGNRALAFAKLIAVAEHGNPDAMLEVLSVLREGFIDRNRIVLAPDQKRAAQYLAKFSPGLPPDDVKREDFLLNAKKPASGGMAELTKQFGDLDPAVKRSVLRVLPRSNAKLFVYIAQSLLKSAGAYHGSVDGNLKAAASRELKQFCLTRATRYFCAQPIASNNYGEIIASTIPDRQNMEGTCHPN